MSIEIVDGVRGEWRNVTKASNLKDGMPLRYEGSCRRFGYNERQTLRKNRYGKIETLDKLGNVVDDDLFAGFWKNIQAFVPLPVKRKVANVEIYEEEYGFTACISLAGWYFDLNRDGFYSKRAHAIRGAKRFCRAIGYEFELIK